MFNWIVHFAWTFAFLSSLSHLFLVFFLLSFMFGIHMTCDKQIKCTKCNQCAWIHGSWIYEIFFFFSFSLNLFLFDCSFYSCRLPVKRQMASGKSHCHKIFDEVVYFLFCFFNFPFDLIEIMWAEIEKRGGLFHFWMRIKKMSFNKFFGKKLPIRQSGMKKKKSFAVFPIPVAFHGI